MVSAGQEPRAETAARHGKDSLEVCKYEPSHRMEPSRGVMLTFCYVQRCGSQLYDDFIELRHGAAKELEDHLNECGRTRSADRSSASTVPPTEQSHSNSSSTLEIHAARESIEMKEDTQSQTSQELSELTSPAIIDIGPEGRWLLMCAKTNMKPTSLTQLDVCTSGSDRELFEALKQAYTSLKSRMSRIFSLKAVKSIKFVQFELHLKNYVDIRKVPDLPPLAQKDNYLYQPCDLIPPVGEHLMTHLFHHPEDANAQKSITFLRTPKKRKQKLIVCPQQGTRIGWGVHLVEGWVLKRVWLATLVVFVVGSVVFAVCWAVLEGDLQGAAGVGGYVVALMGLVLGTVQAWAEGGAL
ncbi:MAG: hypothetical protein Q9195_008940 [Heterodermia aff. obscurata]